MFKKALKFCKNNEKRLKRQKFIRLFQFGNRKPFWKAIRRLNPKKILGQLMGYQIIIKSLIFSQINLELKRKFPKVKNNVM